MANILNFRTQSQRTTTASARLAAGASAEIVIFPGVRYERWADAEPQQPQSRRRRRDEITFEN